MNGFLVIDKPPGLTSHDVVAIVRAVTGVPKVGHTGTLDPFATGVLPLALGRSTRLIQFLDESVKVYDATILLGSSTDTGDPTGKVVREAPVPSLSLDQIDAVLATFVGDRMQEPPAYSAVKVQGRPLYSYARSGETMKAAARPVTIRSVERLSFGEGRLRVRISCSRGTYARVLADEIGVALGTCGHLEALCRDQSGPFVLADGLSLSQLGEMVSPEPGLPWERVLRASRGEDRVRWRPRDEVTAALAPFVRGELACLAHLPFAEVGPADAKRIKSGGGFPVPPRGVGIGSRYLVVAGTELLAVAESTARGPSGVRLG